MNITLWILQVLLALHGMGGSGEDFSKDLFEQADTYGWLIVAPTINYGDWKNPIIVAREDPTLIRALSDYLDQLPQQTWCVADMRSLSLGLAFDGVLAWNSLFHLCHEDQRRMFPIFRTHAAQRAALMFTSGPAHGVAIGTFEGGRCITQVWTPPNTAPATCRAQ